MLLLLTTPLLAADVVGDVVGDDPAVALLVEAIDASRRTVGEASVEPDGSFRVAGVAALPVRLRVSPVDDLGVPDAYYPAGDTWCEGVLIDLEHGVDTEPHAITLSTGGTLTGRVETATGEPAEGAVVVAWPVVDEPIPWQRVATAGADGSFALSGLPTVAAGVYLELVHPDHPDTLVGGYDLVDAQVFNVAEGEERSLGTLALGQGVTLSGRILDSDDQPVPDAVVRVRIGRVTERVRADDDGVWTLAGIRPGRAEIWVSDDDWAVTWWPGDDRPKQKLDVPDDGDVVDDLNLNVSPGASLSGAITGAPRDLSDLSAWAVNDDGTVEIPVQVDSDGHFQALRLSAGTWSLVIGGQDHDGVHDTLRDDQGRVRTWRVDAGEQLEIGNFPWIPGAVVSGRVLDPSGDPIQGARVTATPDDPDLLVVETTTDDHGRYRLPSLVESAYRIGASVDAPCLEDPDFVDAWWPDARLEARAHTVHPLAADDVGELDWVLPYDRDHDGMDDTWEEARGLDPTRDDGGEDPDGDGYSNLEEYQLGTNPTADTGAGPLGGCNNPLSLSLAFLPLFGWRRRD